MQGIKEQTLANEELERINTYQEAGLAALGLHRDVAPVTIVHAISHFIDRWQAQRHPPLYTHLLKNGSDVDAIALNLGVLWGAQVVRTAGWEWTHLQNRPHAVVSSDGEYVIFPSHLIRILLFRGSWGWEENNVVPLFYKIMNGDLAPSLPQQYKFLP